MLNQSSDLIRQMYCYSSIADAIGIAEDKHIRMQQEFSTMIQYNVWFGVHQRQEFLLCTAGCIPSEGGPIPSGIHWCELFFDLPAVALSIYI